MEETEDVSESSGGQTEIQDYQLVRDRQRREIKASKRYVYAHLIAYALTAAYELENDEPRTYKEAVSGRDSERWIKAMKEEIKSLYKNNNWKLVKKPDNRKVVGCKWIYKIKPGIPRVEPERSKAKLFAKGYTQKEGIDFIEVFSHVVRHASIRLILSLVTVNNMHLEQMDVKTAFFHGELKEEIIMTQLEDFVD